MHIAAIIPFAPLADHQTLLWTLEGFAAQTLEPGDSLEILVGVDGGNVPFNAKDIAPSRHTFAVYALERMGAAAVRNELVRRASKTPDLLVFANADTRPAPDMASQHATTLMSLPPKSLVLGASPWERSNPAVLDALIDETPMVFSYCHMQPGKWYPFRTAYSLNLSVRYSDFQEVGGFPEQVRPYYYEDLAFGCRVMGPQRRGVYFQPKALVTHRHPLTFSQYLDREEMLGIMAPALARACPEGFAVLMNGRDVQAIAHHFEEKLKDGPSIHPRLLDHLETEVSQQAIDLGQGESRQHAIERLYRLHLPLKLLAFRVGFLQGLELINDKDWQKRRPGSGWQEYLRACL